MRKGVSFVMTVSVVALILIITAFTVVRGSGGVLKDFYDFADSQVGEKGQQLGGDGESPPDSSENGGDGGTSPQTLTDTEVCWSETEIVICESLEITEGGRSCNEFRRDSNGELMITEAPGDEYVCQWDEGEMRADWVRR